VSADGGRLQEGIFWRHGERPPLSLRLVLLDFDAGATAEQAGEALALIVECVQRLRLGEVRDLAGQAERTRAESTAQFDGLRLLVGFGRRLFDEQRHDPPVVACSRPDFLAYLPRTGEPFPALPWDGVRRTGEADVLMQLTAASEAAVNAAAVEIWKVIVDHALPVAVTESYPGFGRPDGRGWLGFHDGVSNLRTEDRAAAMVAGQHPAWMAGGTYLAFLRLRVDLAAWRALSRAQQELLVGRDKLSGAPLIGTDRGPSGELRPIPASPPAAGANVPAEHRDPPQVTDPVIEASHVHRANQNRASGSAAGGLRMFRQGYEFLDGLGPDGPSLGLTFVSFQRDLSTVQHLLHLPGWLGDVNFGGRAERGPDEPPAVAFVSLVAGGLYAVPPRAGPFPGADVFSG
jgi:deferrochelatase/peroxidase EfeB